MNATSTRARAVTWNVFCGGLAPDGSEKRLARQTEILARLRPDILVLQECTSWDEQDQRRLLDLASALGMVPVAMERSNVGDGRNFTALLYRPDTFHLVGRRRLGDQVFHHTLIRARLRPVGADDDTSDLFVFATHLAHTDGDTRLREARWLTDYGDDFPGTPSRALLLGDLNCSGTFDLDPGDWARIPRNLHARYRLVHENGSFGGMDRRAIQILQNAGWTDPQTTTKEPRDATVGYWWENEQVPLRLDHILVRGLTPNSYRTHDTPEARSVSDHLPVVLDFEVST
ncbi:endonuclease/exonuclease/phosphatase family protein [Streptomyces sp. NPDC000594]|uniref:endonuclease/exonuclease/phosphatase family protein n=1 Tax=Streptomyces sp. NPDC000594 TaxID=3154261 RepID=UPI0033292805